MSRGVLPGPGTARVLAAALAALVAAALAAVLLSPEQPGPAPAAVEAAAYFDPETSARASDYRRGQRAIALVLLALELVVLASLALGRPRVARNRLERLEDRSVVGALLAGAAISFTLAVLTLPGGALAYERAVDVGLSTQGLGDWLWDRLRSAAIGALFAALGAAALILLQRRLRRLWWVGAAGAAVGFAVVTTFLAPVVLAPLFNDFEPLPPGELRSEVLELADRAEVEVEDVFVVDASRRSTTVNAYVDGLGGTRRIVLYDNLLAEADEMALRSIVAHELAHVAQRDIARGLLFVALVAPLGMLFVREAGDRLAARSGTGPGRVSAIPAYALALAIAGLTLSVPGYALSRAVEERADRFALELTDAAGLIELQQQTAETNLSEPDPPRWWQWLFGTHPAKVERIGLAEAYRAERQ